MSNKIRVAENVILQQRTQTWVKATTQRKGAIIFDPKPMISNEQVFSTTNGVAHVQQNVQFASLVAHFGYKQFCMHPGKVVAYALSHQL